MIPSPTPAARAHGPELEAPLSAVEAQLAALTTALGHGDGTAIEAEAAALHRALAAAVEGFSRAARSGGVPPRLRRRLAQAGGQVAAQREALARATAALDQAIEVLLPQRAGRWELRAGGYGGERPVSSGCIQA